MQQILASTTLQSKREMEDDWAAILLVADKYEAEVKNWPKELIRAVEKKRARRRGV